MRRIAPLFLLFAVPIFATEFRTPKPGERWSNQIVFSPKLDYCFEIRSYRGIGGCNDPGAANRWNATHLPRRDPEGRIIDDPFSEDASKEVDSELPKDDVESSVRLFKRVGHSYELIATLDRLPETYYYYAVSDRGSVLAVPYLSCFCVSAADLQLFRVGKRVLAIPQRTLSNRLPLDVGFVDHPFDLLVSSDTGHEELIFTPGEPIGDEGVQRPPVIYDIDDGRLLTPKDDPQIIMCVSPNRMICDTK